MRHSLINTLNLLLILLLGALPVGLPPAAVAGDEMPMAISELTATTSETHLIVFATLNTTLTSEMVETLHSGIPLYTSFFIELYKTTGNRPDEQIVARNFQHRIAFDTLKESYRVTLEEENNKVFPFRTLAEAEKVNNELNGARVIELSQLIPNNNYKLLLRVELHRKTLPMGLQKVLPFFSWRESRSDLQTIEFKF